MQNCKYSSSIQVPEKKVDIREAYFLNEEQGLILVDQLENEKLVILKLQRKKKGKFSIDLMTNYPIEVQLTVNKKEKCMILWNNSQKKIQKVIFKNNNLDIGGEKDLYVYGTHKDIKVEKIISLVYYQNNRTIYFLNQDNYAYTYNLTQENIQPIFTIEDDQENNTIKKATKPQIPQKYEKFLGSENESYILLQCQNNIFIYTLTFSKIKSIELERDFLNGQIIKYEYCFYLTLHFQNKIQLYRVQGGQNDESQKTQQKKSIPKGNSFLDYYYQSQFKYGNKILFLQNKNLEQEYIEEENADDEEEEEENNEEEEEENNEEENDDDEDQEEDEQQYGKDEDQEEDKQQNNFLQYLVIKNKNQNQINEYFEKLQLKNTKIVIKLEEDQMILHTADNFKFIIQTRVPLHVASIEQSKLIPLKNGKNNLDKMMQDGSLNFDQENYQLIKQITEQIDFGVYEEMIKNWKHDIKVISIMGAQSTGKSYLLNKMFGTRFNVDSGRCTDGLWISLSILEEQDDKKVLYILLDCEGLFSLQRTLEEEIRIVLVAVSISDLVILNANNNFDRKLNEFFYKLTLLANKLEGQNLFMSKLLILIRDITYIQQQQSEENFDQEFYRRTQQDQRSFAKAFRTNQYFVKSISHFEQPSFDSEIYSIQKELIQIETKSHWTNGIEFVRVFKTVLSQVFLDDDQNTDKIIFQIDIEEQFRKFRDYFYNGQQFFQENKCIFQFQKRKRRVIFEKDQKDLDLSWVSQQNEIEKVQDIENESIENKNLHIDDLCSEIQSTTEIDCESQFFENSQKLLEEIKKEKEQQNQKFYSNNLKENTIRKDPFEIPLIMCMKSVYEQVEKYNYQNHNSWVEHFQYFSKQFLMQRSNKLLEGFEQQFGEQYLDFKGMIENQKQILSSEFQVQIEIFNFCFRKCKNCPRKCLKNLRHLSSNYNQSQDFECDCFTDHRCQELCKVDECASKNYKCAKEPSHVGLCYCDQSEHLCKNNCSKNACKEKCNLLQKHEEKNHDCKKVHYCQEKCIAQNCNAQCTIPDETLHQIHKCDKDKCTQMCQICSKKACVVQDHFHQTYINNKEAHPSMIVQKDGINITINHHICDQRHLCQKLCSEKGLCQIKYDIVDATTKDKMGRLIPFKKFLPKPNKLNCIITLGQYEINHDMDHVCDQNIQHRCDNQCPECDAFCQLEYGHAGEHFTETHRNKENSIYLHSASQTITRIVVDKDIFEFESGQTLVHDYCYSSCQRKGRAHFHFIECKDQKECLENKYPTKVRHSKEKFKPFIDKQYDLVLCSQYWNLFKWIYPVSPEEQSIIDKCNYYCSHYSHSKADKNFCIKEAWHKEEHEVMCQHDDIYDRIQIAFLVDNTGSMSPYIQKVKKCISKIVTEFKLKYIYEHLLSFAYIGYTDHNEECGILDPDYPVNIRDFTDSYECRKFIKSVKTSGGGNAEAVVDGFKAATELKWEKKTTKFLFHIGDRPPHGKQFTEGTFDSYPDGCPQKLQIKTYLDKMNDLNIRYKLLKIGTYMNLYAQFAKKEFCSYEEIFLDSPINVEENISKLFFKALENEQYDVRIK